jgi:hypothetical protein
MRCSGTGASFKLTGGGYDQRSEHGLRLIISGMEQSLVRGAGKAR